MKEAYPSGLMLQPRTFLSARFLFFGHHLVGARARALGLRLFVVGHAVAHLALGLLADN